MNPSNVKRWSGQILAPSGEARGARGGRSRLSMLAWLPLISALAIALGFARPTTAVPLLGLGGFLVSPIAELVPPPLTFRVRHVQQARAPDVPELSRGL